MENSDWPHTCCSRELLHAVRFCFNQSQRWFVTEARTCSFDCSCHDCTHVNVTQEQLLIKTTLLSLTLSLSVKCRIELPGKILALFKSIRKFSRNLKAPIFFCEETVLPLFWCLISLSNQDRLTLVDESPMLTLMWFRNPFL